MRVARFQSGKCSHIWRATSNCLTFHDSGAGLPSARADVSAVVQRPQLPARPVQPVESRTYCFITNVNLNQYVKRKFCRALVVQTGSDAQTVDGMTPVEMLCHRAAFIRLQRANKMPF